MTSIDLIPVNQFSMLRILCWLNYFENSSTKSNWFALPFCAAIHYDNHYYFYCQGRKCNKTKISCQDFKILLPQWKNMVCYIVHHCYLILAKITKFFYPNSLFEPFYEPGTLSTVLMINNTIPKLEVVRNNMPGSRFNFSF